MPMEIQERQETNLAARSHFGTIHEETNRESYLVRVKDANWVIRSGSKASRSFSWQTYGGKTKAREAAEKFIVSEGSIENDGGKAQSSRKSTSSRTQAS